MMYDPIESLVPKAGKSCCIILLLLSKLLELELFLSEFALELSSLIDWF